MTRPRTGAAAALAVLLLAAWPAARAPAQQPATPPRPALPARPAAPAVTIEQAVELALRNSPAIVLAEGGVRSASAGERAAFGNFLPTLNATSGTSRSSTTRLNPQTNTTVTGSSVAYTAGLSGSMDLFSGGRNLADLRQARAVSDAAQASLVEQRFAVTLAARIAFFDVLRAAELIRVAESQLRQAQEGVTAAEQRLRVGSATRSDALRARLSVTQAEQAVAQAGTQKRAAEFALGRIVGASGPVDAAAPEALQRRPLAVADEQLPALVEAQAPAVAAAEADLRATDATVRAAKAQYFPSLRLSSNYNWLNRTASFDGGNGSWGLSLGLSYPIFNGFAREQTVELAQVQGDVARAQLADARRGARAELESALAELRLAERQIELSEEAVSVAEEDLRVQEERYRLGATTILERLTSQANVVRAATDLVNARYDYQIARARVEALVGRTL